MVLARRFGTVKSTNEFAPRASIRTKVRGARSDRSSESIERIEGATLVRTWIKLVVLSSLFVLVLGTGVAFAQTTTTTAGTTATTTICYPVETQACIDARNAGAQQSTGLPRTGSSSSIPTAAIAAGMVGVGSVLAIAARRRSNARRTLS
jgi:LPXTG-motif cell wall-anchored protein